MEIDEEQLLKDMGYRLANRRDELGKTQEEIAEATGLSAKHISLIELGKKKIQIPTLVKLCYALQFDYTFAITGNRTVYKNKEIQELFETLDSDESDIIWRLLLKFNK